MMQAILTGKKLGSGIGETKRGSVEGARVNQDRCVRKGERIEHDE